MTVDILRDPTPDELAEAECIEAEEAESGKAEAAREKARTAALGKLKKLGLTDAEIDALLN